MNFIREVADDVLCALLVGDCEYAHPLALRFLCVLWVAFIVAGFAWIYMEDGQIWM